MLFLKLCTCADDADGERVDDGGVGRGAHPPVVQGPHAGTLHPQPYTLNPTPYTLNHRRAPTRVPRPSRRHFAPAHSQLVSENSLLF